MRDVSFKVTTLRTATAQAELRAARATLDAVREGRIPKGDPLPVAKVAAILATKKTQEWIPYCHNIPIESVTVDFEIGDAFVKVAVSVAAVAKTGVEMEAMTAAAAAVLTLYDMLKMLDEEMEIVGIRLLEKRGGKSDLPARAGWTGAVLTVSDRVSSGAKQDGSGPVLADGLKRHGADSVSRASVSDDPAAIAGAVRGWVADGVDVVLLTGGTGAGPRDVTPETLAPLFDRRLEGVEEALRSYGQDRMRTAMISRCAAGLMDRTIVIALAGSPAACKDAIEALFPPILHILDTLDGGGHSW